MKRINIHATCLKLDGAGRFCGAPRNAGILLLGESGAGKSDLALRLIERGAKLVSDDRTDIFVERARLYASAPKVIAGFIEVRGLGIVELAHVEKVRVSLAVMLRPPASRIPLRSTFEPPQMLKLAAHARPPLIFVNALEASAPAKIAIAAAAFASGLFRENVKRE